MPLVMFPGINGNWKLIMLSEYGLVMICCMIVAAIVFIEERKKKK